MQRPIKHLHKCTYFLSLSWLEFQVAGNGALTADHAQLPISLPGKGFTHSVFCQSAVSTVAKEIFMQMKMLQNTTFRLKKWFDC